MINFNKLKVGSLVKVKKDLITGQKYNIDCRFIRSMEVTRGKTYRIYEKHSLNRIRIGDRETMEYYFSPSMIDEPFKFGK